jgi:hypothetical protein
MSEKYRRTERAQLWLDILTTAVVLVVVLLFAVLVMHLWPELARVMGDPLV